MQEEERQPLTVKDLIGALAKLPADAVVIMSSDAEGNDFNPLDGIDPEGWWNVAARDLDFDGEPGSLPAVVLFPEHR